MKVLDAFSGLGGWSQAFIDRGHNVVRVDNARRIGCHRESLYRTAKRYKSRLKGIAG